MTLCDLYNVELTLVDEMLGTNPLDPNVMDTHILDRQRKLIMEKSEINNIINKYLKQIPISEEDKKSQLEALMAKIEELLGYELPQEHRDLLIAGDLKTLKETFAELDTKGTTVFFWSKEHNKPMIGRHMILGFLKAAGEAIARTKEKQDRGQMLGTANASHSFINQYVRVVDKFIVADQDIKRRPDGQPQYLQRSLRAETAQGPRISLARSEVLPAGTTFKFQLKVFNPGIGHKAMVNLDHFHQMFSYGEFSGLGQWRNVGFGQFSYKLEKV